MRDAFLQRRSIKLLIRPAGILNQVQLKKIVYNFAAAIIVTIGNVICSQI